MITPRAMISLTMATSFVVALSQLANAASMINDRGNNPASDNCAKHSGEILLVDDGDGVIGLCALGTASIEEWTLFRLEMGIVPQAIIAYVKPDSPAITDTPDLATVSLFCDDRGGELIDVVGIDQETRHLCRFPDSSSIEGLTFLRGIDAPENAALTAVIRKYLP